MFQVKQFCETSSILELDTIQNEAILRDFLNFLTWQHQKQAILRDFLQKWNAERRADGLIPIAPITKKWCQVNEALHLSRKIILANLKIWPEKQRPDLLTSLRNMSGAKHISKSKCTKHML